MRAAVLCALALLTLVCHAKRVTIRNDIPRYDTNGNVVDAHSGNIVYHDGVFFLYGERYRKAVGMDYDWVKPGPNQAPKLGVYTSSDLITWVDRGLCLPPSNETQWIPFVFFDGARQHFVAWWAGWGVATSKDGINFTRIPGTQSSALGPEWVKAGPHLFIDDDAHATGYIIFDANGPAGRQKWPGHLVSIEKLSPDYLSTALVNVTGFFPDDFVEGPTLFKRNGLYYATYGTCCCACREGSGLVIFTAHNISGPWTRQAAPHSDVNCRNASAAICPGSAMAPDPEPIDNPVVPAQGFSVSIIRGASGVDQYVWMANRWLQGPGSNASCTNLCGNPAPEACTTGQQSYRVGQDPTYWALLEFDAAGRVLPLVWRDKVELELPA